MKSCLICDDHAMMRDALKGTVRLAHPGVAVTEAEDFPTAWVAAAARPEFILCDLSMPGAGPEEGVAGVLKAAPTTPVLVVTGNEDDALLLRLLRMGIAGFMPKSSRSLLVESAINLILAGGRYVPPRLIEIMDAGVGSGARGGLGATASTVHLSPRQTEILKAMAMGQTNKEIARAFDLSPATVKAHAAAAFLALGVTNRTEAAFQARRKGLI